ncbi:MAG TPA: Type 1 glutamine amidotransferase-like domain-containing protein [Candidatus Saccharimonadales bacterium]|nr:Type 1 glutamine amidotransferase-like domain-containing protein [Candidatus Saccharimonadales bacterium]
MRLYLSSFRNGNKPDELLKLLGPGRRTALIQNAQDMLSVEERKASLGQEMERLKSIDLKVTEVDLRAYFGRPEALKQDLASYDLVWIRGGNAFVLRRAFKQSGADTVIPELLAEDRIVYSGYSAGIDMLTPSLHGVELVDNPHVVPEGYDPAIIWDCLGLLPYAVAPHYKSDHPESAAIDKSVDYLIDHHVPFIALRDGEAIVIDGDEQKVVG